MVAFTLNKPFFDLVFRYYSSDEKIIEDYEIQAFVNEVSASGTGNKDSGKGMVGIHVLFDSIHQLKIRFIYFILIVLGFSQVTQ